MKHKDSLLLALLAMLLIAATAALSGGWSFSVSSPEERDPAARLAAEGGLPVISLTVAEGKLPGDRDTAARMTVYQMQDGRMRTLSAPVQIKVRGNTSRRFPKKSYRVKIVNEAGEKHDLPLLGLRSDDDWILNPMYGDTSKIREPLACQLWEAMNSAGTPASGSRMTHVEIFINGEYRGLYGLQERVDRKQVSGDRGSGILYKIIANDRPAPQELRSCESEEICRGIELEYAGGNVNRPWDPAAVYMEMLGGDISAPLSRENVIDYGLWAMLCQAHDCHFKNQFVHGVYGGGGYTLYKIPWDLNNTFGDVWKSDGEDTNHTDYRIGDPVIDSAFRVLLETGDPEIYGQIQARWHQLRSTHITEENLIAMAYDLYSPLTGALERDSLRWPQSGMGNGNAANIRDIERFIREILPKMDAFIFGLGSQ